MISAVVSSDKQCVLWEDDLYLYTTYTHKHTDKARILSTVSKLVQTLVLVLNASMHTHISILTMLEALLWIVYFIQLQSCCNFEITKIWI